jgi:protein phosphatase
VAGRASIVGAAETSVGKVRDHNEDAHYIDPEAGIFVVCDGMGGHAAGEVASRMAVETIEAFINDTRDADVNRTWPFPYDTNLSLDGNRIKAAFRLANRRLASAIEADDTLRGMATTAVAVLLGSGTPVVAHVGDSRAYMLRDGSFAQLTQDHSWVGEQVRAGVLSEADARRHPWRNVVTRAIAGGDDPEVEVSALPLQPRDRVLICCDGLSSVVAPDTLTSIVKTDAPLDELCQKLIAAANEAGGPDNITVVMVDVGQPDVA